MTKKLKWVQATIYLTLLCLPGVVMPESLASFNVVKFERREMRAPASFPSLGDLTKGGKTPLDVCETFPAAFEAWFNDHYGLRWNFISGNRNLNSFLNIVHGGDIQGNVVPGQHGRLFLGDKFCHVMSQHTNDGFNITDAILVPLINSFRTRARWLKETGIPFLVLITPDKHIIYPEDLPAWLKPSTAPSVVERFMEAARSEDIPVLYPRSALLKAKDRYGPYVYYRTDTHWSDLGAYYAYREAMRYLSKDFSGIRTLTMAGYHTEPNLKGYDLAKMNSSSDVNDFSLKMDYVGPWYPLAGRTFEGDVVDVSENMRVPSSMDVVISNPKALNDLTVILLRDSFTKALSPLFNQTFSRVIYTSRKNCNKLIELVKTYHPNLVIFQVVERCLPYL